MKISCRYPNLFSFIYLWMFSQKSGVTADIYKESVDLIFVIDVIIHFDLRIHKYIRPYEKTL